MVLSTHLGRKSNFLHTRAVLKTPEQGGGLFSKRKKERKRNMEVGAGEGAGGLWVYYVPPASAAAAGREVNGDGRRRKKFHMRYGRERGLFCVLCIHVFEPLCISA